MKVLILFLEMNEIPSSTTRIMIAALQKGENNISSYFKSNNVFIDGERRAYLFFMKAQRNSIRTYQMKSNRHTII